MNMNDSMDVGHIEHRTRNICKVSNNQQQQQQQTTKEKEQKRKSHRFCLPMCCTDGHIRVIYEFYFGFCSDVYNECTYLCMIFIFIHAFIWRFILFYFIIFSPDFF